MSFSLLRAPAYVALLLAAPLSYGATLASYDFSVLTGTRNDWALNISTTAAPAAWTGDARTGNYLLSGTTEATVASGVSLGNLNGVSPLVYAVAGLADGDLDLAGWVTSATAAGQANVSGYAFFSLAPTAGNSLTLASLTFTGWRNGNGAPDTVNFDYSVDGGTTWLDYGTAVQRTLTGAASVASNVFSQTLVVADGSSVLIRFAPYKSDGTSTSGASTGNWHITGLSLDGTVSAVPEPSSYGLAGAGALAAVAALRRRKIRKA